MKLHFSRVIVPTLVLCLLFIDTKAQELDWIQTAGNYGAMITRDGDDNVISCGYTINDRIFTRKWDKFGNFLWEQENVSGINNNFQQSSWIITDAVNNIYTLGYRYTISSGQIPNAIVLLKYSPEGMLLFKTTIEGVIGSTLRCEMDPQGNIYIGAAGLITGQAQAGFNLIKVDPNGTVIFVSTQNFGSGQYSFYSMRYRNGYVALTGSTAFDGFNCTTVLFDDDGNSQWGKTTQSLSGRDVELDDAGNVYVVNTGYTSGLDQDIKVTKYSVTGTVLFTYFYDYLSNYETPARINLQPDGNLVIIGRSATGITGIETFKLSADGVLLWEHFLETASIPEITFMATNFSTDEIFATGTTSITAQNPAIVTLKYDASGNLEWNVKNSSTAVKGMGLAIATDGSIFVVGQVVWTVLHYVDTTQTETCAVPSNPLTSNITEVKAKLNWNAVPGAQQYEVWHRETGSADWKIKFLGGEVTSTGINNLICGSEYEWQVRAVCDTVAGIYSEFTTQQSFTTSDCDNCVPPEENSMFTTNITANKVKVNWDAVAGAVQYEIWFKPVSSDKWKKKFLDGSSVSSGLNNLTCNTDYEWKIRTICDTTGADVISEFAGPGNFTTSFCKLAEEALLSEELAIAPNPAGDYVLIEIPDVPDGNYTLCITDGLGKVLYRPPFSTLERSLLQLDVSSFPSGNYYVLVIGNDYRVAGKLTVTH